ncbi:MAG: hypothetical protein F6K21_34015 [Symploca sp. SIO2D2]|nr:hypothetical protein [Symploca sp. SIO2D2]
MKIWDLEKRGELLTLSGHQGWVESVSFSPNGKLLASGSDDNTIKIWDLEKGEELFTIFGHQDSVYSVRFSPDGKLLASGSEDNTIKIWDLYQIRFTEYPYNERVKYCYIALSCLDQYTWQHT